jgi:hypothetical protein
MDAAGVGVIQIYSPGKIVAPAQVEVATKATCDPGSLQAGFSLKLMESSVNGDTTGVGSSPTLTCDDRAHRYVLTVFASSGTWIPGAADVYVSTFYETCTSTPTGRTCVGNETAYRYTTTIQLTTPDPGAS